MRPIPWPLLTPLLLVGACDGPRGHVRGPAVAPYHLDGDRPAPITDLLGDAWGEDNGIERKRWIAGMHRTAPGTDWRAMERANAERERRLRRALSRDGTPEAGTWHEIGSRNQAGHTRCATLGPPRPGAEPRLYVGSANGGLWRADLEGRGWSPLSDQLFGGVDEVVACLPPEPGAPDVLLIRRGPDLFRSTDDGASWHRPRGLEGLVAVHRTAVATGDGSQILLLADLEAPAGGVTAILASVDHGASFTRRWTGPGSFAGDMWVPRLGAGRGRDVYLALDGSLLRSTDGGRSFETYSEVDPRASAARLCGSEAGAPTLYMALEAEGAWSLYRSDDGGSDFRRAAALEDFWGPLVAFPWEPDTLLYGGVECYRSTNGGRTFQRVNSWGQYYGDPEHHLHADVRGIDVVVDPTGSRRALCFISTDGGTYVSDDRGLAVTNLSLEGLGVGQIYSTLTSVNDPDLILAGTQDQGYQRGRRRRSMRDGPSSGFDQLLSGDYGYLTSGDGSHGLVYCTYPGFILVQEGEDDPNLLYPWIDFPTGAEYAWLPPVVGDPSDPEAFFFLADHLYRYSRREGPHWSYERHSRQPFAAGEGRYLTALAFAPADPSRVFAANDAGGVWTSSDHGVTWRPGRIDGAAFFQPTCLDVHRDDADLAVVGGSGYGGPGVFATEDGGLHWRPLGGPDLPATLVYDLAFAEDGSEDVYAATEAGAYRYDALRDEWDSVMGTVAPATTYWCVESVPETGIMRFGTYGRGIWDFRPAPRTTTIEAR